MNPQNAYAADITSFQAPSEEYEALNLSMPDNILLTMVQQSSSNSQSYWNQAPWKLEDTDKQALRYLFNEAPNRLPFGMVEEQYTDNRLFASSRAILSYATGRLAQPDITPSSSKQFALQAARDMSLALYQHSLDEHVDQKVRAQVLNLITRKRGWLKLRFDPMAGKSGDIVTDVIPPEDIIIDRYALYQANPPQIHHRVRHSLDELVARFPKKAAELYQAFGIQRGVFTQRSQMVPYYETWFTYLDKKGYPREGVVWWLSSPAPMILDKQPNPNWIYTGDDLQDRLANLTTRPPKPFIGINYLNLGKAAIDETCLFEQAIPQQELLNRRHKQWHKNIDYVNGRWLADKQALSQEQATQIVNKGSKTVALLDNPKGKDLKALFQNVGASPLPAEVYQSIADTRNEIDTIMGTPSVFRGAQPDRQDTLGRDLMLKQQAGALQDDLVRSVSAMYETYYETKLQLMKVYYSEDVTFQAKGGDGQYQFITLSGDTIDTNVKVGVQVDSTLPMDKQLLRQTAQELLKANKIDYLTAMEDMGLPNPDIRTERYYKSQLEPQVYLQSVTNGIEDRNAQADIQALLTGREAEDRDEYDEAYLNAYAQFMTTAQFMRLDPAIREAITSHLAIVQQIAATQADLQQGMLDEAGMLPSAPLAPAPTAPGAEQKPQPAQKPVQ